MHKKAKKPLVFTSENTSPVGTLGLAKLYFKASRELRRSRNITVRNFLLCHALELAMKAMLLADGRSLKFVTALGHNLSNVLEEAKKTNIRSFSEEEEARIELANVHYETKELEYHATGMKQYPEPEEFSKMVEQILNDCNANARASGKLGRRWLPRTIKKHRL